MTLGGLEAEDLQKGSTGDEEASDMKGESKWATNQMIPSNYGLDSPHHDSIKRRLTTVSPWFSDLVANLTGEMPRRKHTISVERTMISANSFLKSSSAMVHGFGFSAEHVGFPHILHSSSLKGVWNVL